MQATIDRDGCIGCGLCASICPAVFRMDDEDKAEAFAIVTPDLVDDAHEAADSCPVSVISFEP